MALHLSYKTYACVLAAIYFPYLTLPNLLSEYQVWWLFYLQLTLWCLGKLLQLVLVVELVAAIIDRAITAWRHLQHKTKQPGLQQLEVNAEDKLPQQPGRLTTARGNKVSVLLLSKDNLDFLEVVIGLTLIIIFM